jgi:hypothetical protein
MAGIYPDNSVNSIERFEDLKLGIKNRHPSQYPGENLEMLGADFRRDARNCQPRVSMTTT